MSAALPLLLFVEDDLPFVRLVVQALADVYALESVTSLRQALTRLREARYYAGILLDVNLPDSRGLSTLLAVLRHARGIPLLVLTGEDSTVMEYAADYIILAKPDINWTTFPAQVQAFLTAYAASRGQDD